MKRQHKILIIAILSLPVLFNSCSDLKKDLPTANSASKIHVAGWTDAVSADFHGKAIQKMNYEMHNCKSCHGADYTGGTSGESCNTCHNKAGGPENCTTCHGSSTGTPAPPKDLLDNMTFTARGVGAHQIHLTGTGTYSVQNTECSGCHRLPSSFSDTNHINGDGRADVVINDPMAKLRTNSVVPNPTYNLTDLKCSNTFCHGNWTLPKSGLASDTVFSGIVMSGANYSPKWNGGSTEKACGTCHGLPPTGHDAVGSCVNCHYDVTTTAGKAKHINGKIDLAGGVVRDFR